MSKVVALCVTLSPTSKMALEGCATTTVLYGQRPCAMGAIHFGKLMRSMYFPEKKLNHSTILSTSHFEFVMNCII